MTHENFRNLPVWQEAMLLAKGGDDLLRDIPKEPLSYSLKFNYLIRDSSAVTRSILISIQRPLSLSPFKATSQKLKELATSFSKQLRAWAAHLQTTAIKVNVT